MMTSCTRIHVTSLLFAALPACTPEAPFDGGEGTTGSTSSSDEGDPSTSHDDDDDDDGGTTDDDSGNAVCGNYMVEPGEICDDGADNGLYGGCALDCSGVAGHCGDEKVQPQESCDDGNDVDGDGCNADCRDSGETLWTVTIPATPGYRVLDAEPTDDGGLILVGERHEEAESVAWLGRLDGDGNLVADEVHDSEEILDRRFIAFESSGDVWGAINELGQRFVFSREGVLTQVTEMESAVSHHTINGSADGRFLFGNSFSPPVADAVSTTTFTLVSHDDPTRELLTFARTVALPPVLDVDGVSYVAYFTEDDNVRLERISADGEVAWTTTAAIPAFEQRIRSSFGVRPVLFLDGEGGLVMVGDAFPSPEETQFHIRRFDRETGDFIMDQQLPVDDVGKCDGTPDAIFCLVMKSGETFVQKYDLDGNLAWERPSPADIFTAYDDGIVAASTGEIFLWDTRRNNSIDVVKLGV